MTDLPKLIDRLSMLRPNEVAELAGLLEKRWGVSAVPAGATPNMEAGPRNWMNLTEAQVNFGLVQRGVVSINFATKKPNQTAPSGMAADIGRLSDVLRPSFLAWWRTGVVHDVSEPRGMSLKKLMDGVYPIRMSATGAFMSLDQAMKDPDTWDQIATIGAW